MTNPQPVGLVQLGSVSPASLILTAVVLVVPIGLLLGTGALTGASAQPSILAIVISVVYGALVAVRVVLPLVQETRALVDLDASTITFGGHAPVPFSELGFAQIRPGRRALAVRLGLDRRTFVTVSNAPFIGSTPAQRAAARAVIAGSELPSGGDAGHPLRDRDAILASMERFF